MMKRFLLSAYSGALLTAGANEIAVTDVVLSQASASRVVTVSYRLGAKPAIVTVDFLTNGVSIGEANFSNVSGDVNRLVTETDSERTITWQPRELWPEQMLTNLTARVKAWPQEEPPDYLVVALADASAPQIAYYVSTNAFPGGGLANDMYRTSRLVMRRIKAADVRWKMGATAEDFESAGSDSTPKSSETAHYVTLTYDYFIGIYPITQEQYRRFTGASALGGYYTGYEDSAIRPRSGLNYNTIRGSGTGVAHTSVTSGSALGKLRSATDVDFDLPSDAEWEYACRAGTDTLLYSGANYTAANVYKLGWVYGNSQYPSPVSARETHAVGQKLPNAWGLYDLYGNTLEWCRDKYVGNLGTNDVFNPVGQSGDNRVMRGSRCDRTWDYARSSSRSSDIPNRSSGQATFYGFRVVCPVMLKYGR